MAWRGLHISNPARLSLADGQIVVQQTSGESRLPLEDVAWIVMDTGQATMTTALLSACMDCGIAIVLTDSRHMPNGMALPFHTHHRQAAISGVQLASSPELRGCIWQRLIQAKLRNQAGALDRCGGDGRAIRAMAARVQPFDPGNIEARGARHYWGKLFAGFVRGDPADLRNSMLDYGYAVMRAAIARALVAAGFLPSIGLRHASNLNPFNLVDDIIEPFRPYVDLAVFRLSQSGGRSRGELGLADRQSLAGVLLAPVAVKDETVTALVATEITAAALVRTLEGGDPSLLLLPQLLSS